RVASAITTFDKRIRVCELLLGASGTQKSKGLLRMIGQGASRRGNLSSAAAMKKRDRQIAYSSKNLGSMTRAKARTVFGKGNIPDVMGAVFNPPVSPHKGK